MLYVVYPFIARVLASRAGLAASGAITIATVCGMRYGAVPKWAELLVDYRSPLNTG